MGKLVSWLNSALYYAKNLPKVKAIVESFVGSGILLTQAKVSLQKSGSVGQLLEVKDQYECLVKLIEKMESTKYTLATWRIERYHSFIKIHSSFEFEENKRYFFFSASNPRTWLW